jgi:hypothetical protein
LKRSRNQRATTGWNECRGEIMVLGYFRESTAPSFYALRGRSAYCRNAAAR